MRQILTYAIALVLAVPSFVTLAPAAAVADGASFALAAGDTASSVAISIESTNSTPTASMCTSMTPEMAEMMALMNTIVDPAAMALHMELMSPEMKQMMSDMMGESTDASSTSGGSHDHTGHGAVGIGVHRFGQANVAQRAVALSRSTYATDTVDNVVLANLSQYQEAGPAAGLAGAVNGPLLPTSASSISGSVMAELDRLGVRRVYIVGSTGHVSESVRRRLENLGFTVVRVAGADRHATAAAVARRIAKVRGVRTLDAVFVVNADKPWDLATATAYSYAKKMPIVFVNGLGAPAVTSRVLTDLRVRRAVVVSTGISVKGSTYRAVARLTPGADTSIVADTRWALADNLGRYAIEQGWATAAHPVVSNGAELLPDALVAGPHAGAKGGVLLLTPSASLPRVARVFLVEHRASISHPVVAGTTAAVSEYAATDMLSLLKSSTH